MRRSGSNSRPVEASAIASSSELLTTKEIAMTEMMAMEAAEILRKHLEEAGGGQLREMVRFLAEP